MGGKEGMHRFIIVGTFYPPFPSKQLNLFDLS
jgi:hypothetical protein